jgi:hypothetical protein
MAITGMTRRAFLRLTAVAGLIASAGCPRPRTNGVTVFKRSGKGLHVSNAAKKHNANRLYRTLMAALNDAPHPGDNSKVVELIINRQLFQRLFPGMRQIADLRRDL